MSASENQRLVEFTDLADTGRNRRKSNGRSSATNGRPNSANGKSSVDGNRRQRKKSNKHFQHKKQKLNIDFVLAAKNFDRYDDLTEKNRELDYLRKKYFHNLKKKRLKISKPFLSQVKGVIILYNKQCWMTVSKSLLLKCSCRFHYRIQLSTSTNA